MNTLTRSLLLMMLALSCFAGQLVAQVKDPVIVPQREMPWEKFSPAGGGFTVLLPGKPVANETPIETKIGTLINHSFIIELYPMAYMVGYAGFPSPVTDTETIRRMLDGARDQALSQKGMELKSETEIKLRTNFGRDWVVNAPSGLLRARAYWANQRLYQLVVFIPKSEAGTINSNSESLASKFLDSFALEEVKQ